MQVDLTILTTGLQSATGGDATNDVISGFEDVFGSDAHDSLTGNDGANFLQGRRGVDLLYGGDGNDPIGGVGGADLIFGGDENDLATYLGSFAGVTVSLAAGTALGGAAQGDILSEIEGLIGSNHADSLTGDAGVNWLYGGVGDDTLQGEDGNDFVNCGAGDDLLIGGAGDDKLTGGRWRGRLCLCGRFGP